MYSFGISFDNSLVKLVAKLQGLADRQQASLAISNSLIGVMRKRIHEDGIASDGSQIGTYSPGYMKVRTGDFGNHPLVSKGKNKGKPKEREAGVFTKGKHKGQPRPVYNRTSDTKVILSLKRQQENDLSVIAADNVSYGIGYKNELNYNKSVWEEETYNKKIFSLTEDEQAKVNEALTLYSQNAIR